MSQPAYPSQGSTPWDTPLKAYIDWGDANAVGQVGPAGPEGPIGPEGPAGPQGVQGVPGPNVVFVQQTEPLDAVVNSLWVEIDSAVPPNIVALHVAVPG